MSLQGTKLSKIFQSIAMNQLNSIRNQVFKLNSQEVNYPRFHSQFGEDRYIYKHLKLPKRGVFVDVGAGHPSYLSNTYFFEKNGWTGVCIDADPAQIQLLKKARANVESAAISAQDGEINFSQAYFPDYSSSLNREAYKGRLKIPVKKTIKVPSYRLETVLEKYQIGQIDLLDIDVEGTEIEVWQSFDYQKHQPKVVIIEYQTFGLADNSQKIKEFFLNLPYKLVRVTCTNFIFLNVLA